MDTVSKRFNMVRLLLAIAIGALALGYPASPLYLPRLMAEAGHTSKTAGLSVSVVYDYPGPQSNGDLFPDEYDKEYRIVTSAGTVFFQRWNGDDGCEYRFKDASGKASNCSTWEKFKEVLRDHTEGYPKFYSDLIEAAIRVVESKFPPIPPAALP